MIRCTTLPDWLAQNFGRRHTHDFTECHAEARARCRRAGSFGLLVEALTLHWAYPAAFLVFALAGFPVLLLGILLFLYSLVSVKAHDSDRNPSGL